LLNASVRGALSVDHFGGSGSILIAGMRAGADVEAA